MSAAPSPTTTISPERTLRRLFFTLFLRGRTSRGLRRPAAPKSVMGKLWMSLTMYALTGCVAFFMSASPVFQFSLYLHSITLVLCGMFIAGSAGETLFNKDEGDILLHRPITPQALLRAKLVVLLQVSLWLAGAFNLAGLCAGLFSPDATAIYPLVHAVSTVLEAMFCTGAVVLAYELCLRFFGREKLEGVMTTVQIFVAIGTVLAGQLPRLVGYVHFRVPLKAHPWWLDAMPPTWFAGFDDALAGSGASEGWLLGGLGVALTATVVWLAVGRMARHYETGLQMMSESSGTPSSLQGSRRWLHMVTHAPPLRWWLRQPMHRASFLLVASYLLRDRDVKLRVYPALAPAMIMPLIFLLPNGQNSGINHFGIAFAGSYLGMVPLFALDLIQYSQQWQAADIFRVAPMAGPAPLLAGARQAVTCLLTLPLILVFSGVVFFLHRDSSQLGLLAPGLIAMPIFTYFPHLGGRAIPFSTASEEARSAHRGLNIFVVMLLSVGVAFLALWAWHGGWFGSLLAGEATAVAIVIVLMRRSLAAVRWTSLE